ncbi:MAG: NAD-dependent deacylase [Rhodospirillaceae bacterium]|nr:MAG: NAD-dependent deacylase [Rhodospirillaceae bacterium]
MQAQPNSFPPVPPTARIVILTGAGISQESGLETFRDPDGIWAKVRVEDVATPEAFARDPDRVHAFYNMRRARHRTSAVVPNAAHAALARLEREWPGDVLVVTQNVDSLHERAGTTKLIHMHGVHSQARCNGCGHVVPWDGDMSTANVCGGCGRAGGLRPHVVWFGEMPLEMSRIQEALSVCDLFISIGTSGNVYPAAGFVRLIRRIGQAHTVELNLEPSRGANLFAESCYGPASQIVPAYVDGLLNGA